MKRYNGNTPDWFVLQNYDFFKSLSSKDICYEIEIRRLSLEYLKSKNIIEAKKLLIILRHKCSFIRTMELKGVFNHNSSDRFHDFFKYLLNEDNMFIDFILSLKNLPSEFIHNICNKFPRKPVDTLLIENLYFQYFIPKRAIEIYKKCILEHYSPNNRTLISLKGRVEKMCIEIERNYSILDDEKVFIPTEEFGNKGNAKYILDAIHSLFVDTLFNKSLTEKQNSSVIVDININTPDEVIINKVMELVQEERQSNSIKNRDFLKITSKNKKSGGVRKVTTFIEQRIIQYLDLYIWNLENNQQATNAWYISKIFSDIPRSEPIPDSKMNDTIKPTAKKCLDEKWLNSFFHLDIPSYNVIKDKY